MLFSSLSLCKNQQESHTFIEFKFCLFILLHAFSYFARLSQDLPNSSAFSLSLSLFFWFNILFSTPSWQWWVSKNCANYDSWINGKEIQKKGKINNQIKFSIKKQNIINVISVIRETTNDHHDNKSKILSFVSVNFKLVSQ